MTDRQQRIFERIDRLFDSDQPEAAKSLTLEYLDGCRTQAEGDDLVRWQIKGMLAKFDDIISQVRQRAITHPHEPPRDIEPLILARGEARKALAFVNEDTSDD